MSRAYFFWIETKPVPWSRPRANFQTGAIFNSKPLRTYESLLRTHFVKKMNHGQLCAFGGPLEIALSFYLQPPKRKVRETPCVKPDLDNLTKAVKDAGNGVLWKDDGQIIRIRAEKLYDWTTRKVGIEITVTEVLDEA